MARSVPKQTAAVRGSTSVQRKLPVDVIASGRALLVKASNVWLPRAVWSVQRTGRPGLAGIALIMMSVVFLISTHLNLAQEVESLRSQLERARTQTPRKSRAVTDPGSALLHSLPVRGDMPALLGVLLKQADDAHLAIDTGKYEATETKTGRLVRYQVSFPVVGPYPQVRQFIDATLTALPAVAIRELSLQRKTIGDSSVEAQIGLTVFTREKP
jgi:Tfp pilus assembly protein PilO